jgi:hypothetical protein
LKLIQKQERPLEGAEPEFEDASRELKVIIKDDIFDLCANNYGRIKITLCNEKGEGFPFYYFMFRSDFDA